ncbi:flagellar hook-length control protein FliK [Pseudoroseomonas wenyumeiae]
MTPASGSVRASHRDNPLPLPVEMTAARDAVVPESPAGTETSTLPPQQGRVVPATEAIMRMDPVADAKAPATEAMAPAPAAPEFRAEAPRQAAPPVPTRPHLPPEAGQQLALRVVTAAANRVESVSVDLRPPELGRVELRLTFHDGTVQVSMAAERGDTFEALRQDRVHLEQQMQQAGLQLSSGGLDLQHGHLPREAPEPPATLPAPTEGAAAAEDEAPPSRRPPSDSLIDLIA